MKKKKRLPLNERGNISLFLVSILLGSFLLIIGAFVIPMILVANTTLYEKSEFILELAQEEAAGINDQNVRQSLITEVQLSKDAIVINQTIFSFLFQYWWFVVGAAMFIVLFLATRQQKEVGYA